MRFLVGDLLTGRRIQTISPSSGSWSEVLNDAGELQCTVPLYDPVNYRLDLCNTATVGKAFLAAVEGDTVLQAGPIWKHTVDGDELTLHALGMWSYFDHRVLLPVLGANSPADPVTDTRYWPAVLVEGEDGYPWPGDTRSSLQDIARDLVAQAKTWTGGNVPVNLPTGLAGTAERWYRGADLAIVGRRLRELSAVEGGPDIMFTPKLQSDRLGVEWDMRIGTPTEPKLFGLQRRVFQIGVKASAVTDVKVVIDGSRLASQTFAAGGRTLDKILIAKGVDATLTSAGYPLLEQVDSAHSTVAEAATLQQYADELATAGRTPSETWSFSHDSSSRPFVYAYNAGDFAEVRVRNHLYLEDGANVMRILTRRGELGSTKVKLQFAPEVA